MKRPIGGMGAIAAQQTEGLPLFAEREAAKARDAALTQVESHNKPWLKDALEAISTMAPGFVGTGEDVRGFVSSVVREPGHPNAWGALIGQAVRKGYLVPTGRYIPMKDKRSHARKTPEYRRA